MANPFRRMHDTIQGNPNLKGQLQQQVQAGLMGMNNPNMNYGMALSALQKQAAQEEERKLLMAQQAQQQQELQAFRKAQLAQGDRRIDVQKEGQLQDGGWADRLARAGVYSPESIMESQAARAAGDPGYIGLLRERPILSAAETKILDESQATAAQAERDASQMIQIGQKFLEVGSDTQEGWLGQGRAFLRDVLGEQKDIDLVRNNYNALRMRYSLQSLPPGPASDRDVALALKGWPKEFEDKEHMYSFLMGMQKLALVDAAYNRGKSGFISSRKTNAGFQEYWDNNKADLIDRQFASLGLNYNKTGKDIYADLFAVPAPGTGAGAPEIPANETIEQRYNRLMGGSNPNPDDVDQSGGW